MRFKVNISECMTEGVHTLDVGDSALAAAKLLKEKEVGSIIITDGGDAVGILTERDIIYKIVAAGQDAKKVKLKDVMSSPLKAISTSNTVQDAALAMKENKIKRLPVLDKSGKLVGIVSEGDLLRVYPGIVDIMAESPHMRGMGETD
ncbi:CBS domain-containing protein [Candidatus Micrarchaeota archaeon CG10_big_fil_rev_8_21_14_0_10_45_29]|nr:MAG: CBS domain-containing protein [Candidatus Micrarchaeota archaeon CG10_big_fil_rev_8_21_14_0_10_45_29]